MDEESDLTSLNWLLTSNIMPNVTTPSGDHPAPNPLSGLPVLASVNSSTMPPSGVNPSLFVAQSQNNQQMSIIKHNSNKKSSTVTAIATVGAPLTTAKKSAPVPVASKGHGTVPSSNVKDSSKQKKKLLVHQKTNAHKLAEFHKSMLLKIDYKNDSNAKPPYSYAALICLSMKDTKKKMTLSQIYKWIRENFAFYRSADKSWQVH